MTEQQSGLVPAAPGGLSFGQTSLRPQDLVVPRVKIVQQMSAEAQGKKGETKASPGDFFNTLTGENYGDKLRIQAIQPFMQRILLVRSNRRDDIDAALEGAGMDPLSEGDGLKCRSYDMVQGRGEPGVACETECPLAQWRPGNLPPLCTETYNIAACNEFGELLVISFSKSSAKVGKRLFSTLRLRPGAPWLRFFDLATDSVTNEQGTFFVPDFTIAKEQPPDELIRQAVHWATELRAIDASTIDVTPDDEDTDGSGGAPKGDEPF